MFVSDAVVSAPSKPVNFSTRSKALLPHFGQDALRVGSDFARGNEDPSSDFFHAHAAWGEQFQTEL